MWYLQICFFCLDCILDCICQCIAVQVSEIVICQIFQLQLIGQTVQTICIACADNGVSQLPNLTNGILECAVAINHSLYLYAGACDDFLLDFFCNLLCVLREQFDGCFCCLIGAQQTVLCIVAAAVYGCVQDFCQCQNLFAALCQNTAFGAFSVVNITAQHFTIASGWFANTISASAPSSSIRPL